MAAVPETARYPQHAQQFYIIALETFRRVDETAQEELPLSTYLQDWSSLLLSFRHDEVCSREDMSISMLILPLVRWPKLPRLGRFWSD